MKKICIITGSRAEYGLLKNLIEELISEKDFQIQIIATGTHLSTEFGLTYKEIEKDGYIIGKKIEIILSSDTPVGISKAMGLAQISFSEAFDELKPDFVIVLGDRFEIFAACSTAHVFRIPICHLHGGEVTEGAVDDAFRHSITKMSFLHFTSCEEYRKRVIQLGEAPDRVYNVGAIGLDGIRKINYLTKGELEKELSFKFNKKNLLITFHPVTLENNTAEPQFKALLGALDDLTDTNLIFTKTNADTEGRIINKMIDEYVGKNKNSISFVSMGQLKYLSAMKYVDAVVGNSSSGIIEAPSFKIGTINIGDRQTGRLKAESIIDCEPDISSIRKSFDKLYSREFKIKLSSLTNPYGDGFTAKKIVQIIKTNDIFSSKKVFYDISC